MATLPPDDLEQRLHRLNTIKRLLVGLTRNIDEMEREMLALYAPQSDGERAAAEARQIVYRHGPQETKIIS